MNRCAFLVTFSSPSTMSQTGGIQKTFESTRGLTPPPRLVSHTNRLRCRAALAFIASFMAVTCLFAEERSATKPALQVITDKSERPIAFEAIGLSASDLEKIAAGEDSAEAFGRVLSVSVADDSAA